MLKKLLLPLALFLTLILCASCACAAAFPYDILQKDLTELIIRQDPTAADSEYFLRIDVPDEGSLSALRRSIEKNHSALMQDLLSFLNYGREHLDAPGWSDTAPLPAYSARLPVVGADGRAYNIVVKGVLADLSIVKKSGDEIDPNPTIPDDITHLQLSFPPDALGALIAVPGASSAPIVAMDIVHFTKNPYDGLWSLQQVFSPEYDYNHTFPRGFDLLENLYDGSDFPYTLVQTEWVEGGSFAELQAAHDNLINSVISFTLQSFSPFLFMWVEYEPVADAPALPETGDSSSLAPWLLLLGGACALLLLSRRSRHA